MKQLGGDRNHAKGRVSIGHIANMRIYTEYLGKYHDAARCFPAFGLGDPRQHCGSILNFDFDVF